MPDKPCCFCYSADPLTLVVLHDGACDALTGTSRLLIKATSLEMARACGEWLASKKMSQQACWGHNKAGVELTMCQVQSSMSHLSTSSQWQMYQRHNSVSHRKLQARV